MAPCSFRVLPCNLCMICLTIKTTINLNDPPSCMLYSYGAWQCHRIFQCLVPSRFIIHLVRRSAPPTPLFLSTTTGNNMVDLAASSQAGLFRGYMKVATGPAPSLRLRPLSCRVQPCHPSMNPHQAYHAWTPGAYRGWTWRSVTSPCSFSIHGVYVDDRLSRRKSHKVLQPLHRWARGRPSIASNATGRAHYSTARQCHAKAMDTPAPLKAPTQGSKEGGAQGTSRDASDGTDAGQTFGHESSGAHGPDMTSTSSSTASSHVQAHETTVTYDLCIGYASKAKRPSVSHPN